MSNPETMNKLINKISKPAEIANHYSKMLEHLVPPSAAFTAQSQIFANTAAEIFHSCIQNKINFVDYQRTFSNIFAISQIERATNLSVINSSVHSLTTAVASSIKPLSLSKAFIKSLEASNNLTKGLEKELSITSLVSSISNIHYAEDYVDFPEPLASIIEQSLEADEPIYQNGVPSTRFKRMSTEKFITYCTYIISIITFILTVCGFVNDVSSSITEEKHHEELMKEEHKQTKELEKSNKLKLDSNKLQQESNEIHREQLKFEKEILKNKCK